jgi:DNA invertase Pin-like site-specific DNA recombinase
MDKIPLLENISSDYVFGYIRVSTNKQVKNKDDLVFQQNQLEKAGVLKNNVFTEQGDVPYVKNLPGLDEVTSKIPAGGALVICRIDQISRDSLHFLLLKLKLAKKTIKLVSLDLPVDKTTDDLISSYFVAINIAISDYEKIRIKDLQREGIEVARKKGKYNGRRSIITDTMIQHVKKRRDQKIPTVKIAKELNCSRTTIYKVLKENLNYTTSRLEPLNTPDKLEKINE